MFKVTITRISVLRKYKHDNNFYIRRTNKVSLCQHFSSNFSSLILACQPFLLPLYHLIGIWIIIEYFIICSTYTNFVLFTFLLTDIYLGKMQAIIFTLLILVYTHARTHTRTHTHSHTHTHTKVQRQRWRTSRTTILVVRCLKMLSLV